MDVPEQEKVQWGTAFFYRRNSGQVHTVQTETKECTAAWAEVDGKKVVVIDTPGLFSIEEYSNIEILREISKSILMAEPGAHAIVVVIPCQRIAQEFEDTVQLLVLLFGKKAYE